MGPCVLQLRALPHAYGLAGLSVCLAMGLCPVPAAGGLLCYCLNRDPCCSPFSFRRWRPRTLPRGTALVEQHPSVRMRMGCIYGAGISHRHPDHRRCDNAGCRMRPVYIAACASAAPKERHAVSSARCLNAHMRKAHHGGLQAK